MVILKKKHESDFMFHFYISTLHKKTFMKGSQISSTLSCGCYPTHK